MVQMHLTHVAEPAGRGNLGDAARMRGPGSLPALISLRITTSSRVFAAPAE